MTWRSLFANVIFAWICTAAMGCGSMTLSRGPIGAESPTLQLTSHHGFWGFAKFSGEIQPDRYCSPKDWASVQVYSDAKSVLLTLGTFGLYTPLNVTIRCQ